MSTEIKHLTAKEIRTRKAALIQELALEDSALLYKAVRVALDKEAEWDADRDSLDVSELIQGYGKASLLDCRQKLIADGFTVTGTVVSWAETKE